MEERKTWKWRKIQCWISTSLFIFGRLGSTWFMMVLLTKDNIQIQGRSARYISVHPCKSCMIQKREKKSWWRQTSNCSRKCKRIKGWQKCTHASVGIWQSEHTHALSSTSILAVWSERQKISEKKSRQTKNKKPIRSFLSKKSLSFNLSLYSENVWSCK